MRSNALLVAGLALAAAIGPLGAQEQVDSARLKVMERLQRLGRPPGYDSILFVQDSVRLEDALQGRRPSGGGGDSITAALFGMPGFTLTEYQSETANFDAAQRILVLTAADGSRARVSREGMNVEADSTITFNDASGRLITTGMTTFTPPDQDPVESVSLIYDIEEQRGSAFDASTSFSEGGGRWNVTGDMPYAAPDSSFMSHARFTSCELEEPHYHFETDQIKIIGGSVLVARPVRLYFADVPVVWLPFIAQSLSQGRASGILTPRFSVNDIVRTSGGYRRRVSNIGFYWAMGDYSDALVAMDWFSDNFLSLTSSVRYKFNKQFLDGDLNFRRYWRQDGSSELALDTRHNWDIDERTQLRISGRYASSNDFVRENSFNPAEVTQSIDSEGGINRRFDWGSLSLGANRKQYLSDDRTEWTLPSANLSLSTITLFPASSTRGRFYNNMTWSGSANLTRRTVDKVQPTEFEFSGANTANMTSAARSSLSLGSFSFAQSVKLTERTTMGVPDALLMLGDSASPMDLIIGSPATDIAQADLTWNASLDYQKQIIGSTTFTPRLSISGSMERADTSLLARNFVSAPMRVSFGATLKGDLYGIRNNVLGFEAIRHKISPSITWDWSPESAPTQLQRDVFGVRALQPKNAVAVTINQTWEAKRKPEEPDSTVAAADTIAVADSIMAAAVERAEADSASLVADTASGPAQLVTSPPISLLALRTSVVRYDFVQADSIGSFLSGFETTRLSNQISSDYLRGLSISVDHELFDETPAEGEAPRVFAPHLAQVNFSFALSSNSQIFRWLGFLGTDEEESPADQQDDEELQDVDPFEAMGPTDESSIVPGGRREPRAPRAQGSGGGWNANFSYALQRPRGEGALVNQMLTGTVTLRPTEMWDVSWRTAYDLERNAFNDHTIRLTRDLHRWQANFDFLQTATGNWSFRFEVSLIDNSDLKFDYQQRNLDVGLPSSRRR